DLERDVGIRILSTSFLDLRDSLRPPIGIGAIDEVGGLVWGCCEPMLLRRCEPKRCPHRDAAGGTYDNKQRITSDTSLHRQSRRIPDEFRIAELTKRIGILQFQNSDRDLRGAILIRI